MSTVEEKLILLKKSLHPEVKLDIITQSQIVADVMMFGSKYEDNQEELAEYLDVSPSKVYQMKCITLFMLPIVKKWFKKSTYQAHTTSRVANYAPKKQLEWLRGQVTMVTGITPMGDEYWNPKSDSLSQTKTEEEEA